MLVGNMKPFFIAPELLRVTGSDDEVERQSSLLADIYSYGACLWYELMRRSFYCILIVFTRVLLVYFFHSFFPCHSRLHSFNFSLRRYILTEKKNRWKNMSYDQVKTHLHSKSKESGVLPATVDPALNKLIFGMQLHGGCCAGFCLVFVELK
jgi:hypothetical protein